MNQDLVEKAEVLAEEKQITKFQAKIYLGKIYLKKRVEGSVNTTKNILSRNEESD
jgi:hypothetical protein